MSAMVALAKKEWVLRAETEIRCEVTEAEPLTLKLLSGNAEIFGVEMAINKEYTFLDENVAVFTWYGGVVESTGSCQIYESDSTPMVAYVNTHCQLEAIRDVSLYNSEYGPRVMIVGPKDHGKSTIARVLSSYAARLDRTPILVDLDVGQGSLCIPGCICAVPLDKSTLSVEEEYSQLTPLVYYFGHTAPGDNTKLYKQLVSALASKVQARLSHDADARASGIFINTCGWTEGAGYDVLLHCMQAFAVDVVLVMGHDKLYSRISSEAGEGVIVVKLPRSGGVVDRDAATRARGRKSRIREYFYGRRVRFGQHTRIPTHAASFFPDRRDIPISSVMLLRASGIELSEGMKLVDSNDDDAVKLVRVQASQDLMHSIVAVLHDDDDLDPSATTTPVTALTDANDVPQQLLSSNIAGFLWIVQLDVERDVMSVLAPCPGALPSKYKALLVGSIKWVD